MLSFRKTLLAFLLSAPTLVWGQTASVVEFDFFMESVAEDVDSVVVNIVLDHPNQEEIRVYVINEVSTNASIGVDFEMPSPYEIIIPAQHPGPVSMVIYIIDDNDVESAEAIMLAIESTVGNATTGLEAEHVIWIEDNDICEVTMSIEDSVVCSDGMAVPLFGQPEGGTFWGEGVIGSSFYPQLCEPGDYTLKYALNQETCSDTSSTTVKVSVCSSVEETDANTGFLLFPTYVSNVLSIRLSDSFRDQLLLAEIYNTLGVLVYAKPIEASNQVDCSNLSKGAYIFKLKEVETNSSRVQRFVKL